jgi:NAD(P)H-flavin reductase
MNLFLSTLLKKKEVVSGMLELKYSAPKNMTFAPGQHADVYISSTEQRKYSIIDIDDGVMTIVVGVREDGIASEYFKKVHEGAMTQIRAPIGSFTCSYNNIPKMFIGAGTGVLPFISMIEELDDESDDTPVFLITGMKKRNQDVAYHYLKDLIEDKDIKYTRCLSEGRAWRRHEYKGRITDYIDDLNINWGGFEVYVCGKNHMVQDVQKILNSKDVLHLSVENYG